MEKNGDAEKPESGRPLTQPAAHSLHLENRKKAALTGVKEVLAFDENQVILLTDAGEICLMGDGLHVTKLMLEEGQLTVEGKLDGITYSDKQEKRRGWRRGL